MFSKSCEYGIKATIYIAQKSLQGKRVPLDDIAKAIDSPVAFTAKILQLLSKNKIINSIKGFAGGYEIPNNKLEHTTLFQIVEAIDGDSIYNGCGLGLKECNELLPCPIHSNFKKIRNDLKKMLQKTSILTLATNLDNVIVHLKRN